MFSVEFVAGIALFGLGLAILGHVWSTNQTRTRAQRWRLAVLPALAGGVFYVIAFALAGFGEIWIVPTGFAGMALISLAEVRLMGLRVESQGLGR